MEAVTIAGLAVVAVGGYFSVVDFLADIGLTGRTVNFQRKAQAASGRVIIAPESRVKKMAGMHI